MKSIVVVNNSSKKIWYLLNNLTYYEIDKEDHILRIHRYIDGDYVWDNIQLMNGKFYTRCPGYIVEREMVKFLADGAEDILDISAYVDQEAMMRDDEDEEELEEDPGHCSQCGEHIDHMWQIAAITDDGEGNVKRYCSSDCLLAACNQDRLEAERELQKEEDNPSIFDSFMEQLKKDRALTTEEEDSDLCSQCGNKLSDTIILGADDNKRFCTAKCAMLRDMEK